MPIIKHKNPFGGDAGNRTRVHNAFATKELQQYQYYTTKSIYCQSRVIFGHSLLFTFYADINIFGTHYDVQKNSRALNVLH